MNIRPAQTHEAEVLSALALKSKAHWRYSAEAIESWKEELSISAHAVASRATFVATRDDEMSASLVTVDADPNAESFYLACGADRCGGVSAPLPEQPGRVRPQFAFKIER